VYRASSHAALYDLAVRRPAPNSVGVDNKSAAKHICIFQKGSLFSLNCKDLVAVPGIAGSHSVEIEGQRGSVENDHRRKTAGAGC